MRNKIHVCVSQCDIFESCTWDKPICRNKLQTYSLLRLQVQNLILQQQMVKSPNHCRCLKQNVLILLIAWFRCRQQRQTAIDRQTDRQTDWQIDWQTDRLTDRQTDRHRHTHTPMRAHACTHRFRPSVSTSEVDGPARRARAPDAEQPKRDRWSERIDCRNGKIQFFISCLFASPKPIPEIRKHPGNALRANSEFPGFVQMEIPKPWKT